MKIRHKILLSLLSILGVLILITVTTYKASEKVDFYQERSEFLGNQLSALTNLRAQVRNQILETYEVCFVEGTKNHIREIGIQREQVNLRFAELEKIMSTSEVETSDVKLLKLEYSYLDQGLTEGIAAAEKGLTTQAKQIILKVREDRFNQGFIKKISEMIEAHKAATKESGQELDRSISKLKDVIGLFAGLAFLLMIGITIYQSNAIGGRLASMEGAIHRIAEGDYQVSLLEKGSDEVALLAKAFNQMTLSLSETRERLRMQQEVVTHSSKMSALGEMAGGVAHEINTPLAVIQMRADQLLEAIEEKNLDPELLHNSLKAIDQTVRRISKIINGLRAFARDGRKDPLAPHSAVRLVEDTFSLCRERFKNHGVSLEFSHSGDVEILCRPSEIGQVLLNLLNNSFDAIQDLQSKWVKVELQDREQEIAILIIDSGPGIPDEIQKKMMQPFFTTKEIGKGTGLGLSISKGIVESHHGLLQIDNSRSNTTFIIRFPKNNRTLKQG